MHLEYFKDISKVFRYTNLKINIGNVFKNMQTIMQQYIYKFCSTKVSLWILKLNFVKKTGNQWI